MAACYSQDKFNTSSGDVLAVAIITLPTLAGLGLNGFVVSALCLARLRRKSFTSSEKILLFLGCSRLCYLGISWLYSFLSTIYPWCFYVQPLPQVMEAVQSFFNAANTWASACLCVFYCIKVATFRHRVFTALKAKADWMVPWLLLVSVLVSLIIGTLAYDITHRALVESFNASTSGHLWRLRVSTDEHYFPVFFISGSVFAAAFVAAAASALLLLFSLWRHRRQVRASAGKDVSVDAHVKAMRSILAFILIYTLNFACFVLSLVYATEKDNAVVFVIFLFQFVLPAAHSLVVICSNPRLERSLLRALPCVQSRVC